jgi:Spy/CpxP family protein refolding chaperone
MNKPKLWLLAAVVAAAVLPLSLLGVAATSAQAGPGPGKVATTQVDRGGETGPGTAVPSWGWPVGW